MVLNPETREALKAMRIELEEVSKEEARRKGKEYGRKLDQIEISYKQYCPPQLIDNVSQ